MDKTRRVEINRSVKHPKYKKYVSRRTVCHVHDENNESGVGRSRRDHRVRAAEQAEALAIWFA